MTRQIRVLIAILALAAAQRLGDGFWHLLLGPDPPVDLRYRWDEVHQWFAGEPVYRSDFAVYPPASYPMLWPLLGWVPFSAARWVWGITSAIALAWLSRTAARESGVRGRAALLAAALVPLAMYASRAVIINGQIALHLLPLAIGGVLLLARRPPSWTRDLAGAGLLLGALAKPTLTAPFVWIAMTVRGPIRPTALLVGGYVGLTLFAAWFSPTGLLELLQLFAHGSVHDAVRAASSDAHANVHSWLAWHGLGRAFTVASLSILAALGAWTIAARRADPWILLGVAAIVARMWAFHYRYDDVLIAVALVPLGRMALAGSPGERDRPAAALLALVAATLLMPARLLFPPAPWAAVELAQTAVWLAALTLLLYRGAGGRRGRGAAREGSARPGPVA